MDSAEMFMGRLAWEHPYIPAPKTGVLVLPT